MFQVHCVRPEGRSPMRPDKDAHECFAGMGCAALVARAGILGVALGAAVSLMKSRGMG